MIHTIEQAHSAELGITGVVFQPLKTYPDDRGFFREIIRDTDPYFASSFGQWSHSKMGKKTVKAWHFHHRQTDWWYCGVGAILTVLYDMREESPTYQRKMEFKMGDSELDSEALCAVIKIPPGVAHGLKVLSDPVHLFYVTSHLYDPQDEGRIPFNSPAIPHSWGGEGDWITSERDRMHHTPPYVRELITSAR